MADKEKYTIEYMVWQKSQATYTASEEVEEKSHLDAAWLLQQRIKNELDPNGVKGVNVIVNLNP